MAELLTCIIIIGVGLVIIYSINNCPKQIENMQKVTIISDLTVPNNKITIKRVKLSPLYMAVVINDVVYYSTTRCSMRFSEKDVEVIIAEVREIFHMCEIEIIDAPEHGKHYRSQPVYTPTIVELEDE